MDMTGLKNIRGKNNIDGTPCAVKVACTVWTGGKAGDNIKGLPIGIVSYGSRQCPRRRSDKMCGLC